MANERTTSVSISVTKGAATINSGSLSKQSDMAGTDMGTNTQSVGTTNEVLNIPADIAQPIDLVVKNLDGTNYVEIFRDAGNLYLLTKLLPGESCLLRRLDVIPFGRANIGAVQIQWWACEI